MLLCNAALFEPGGYATSPDGLELVKGLLDELETGAPARVVLQSSHAEKFGGLDFDNLKGNKFKESGMSSYSCAKLWMLMFGEELQRQGPRAAQIDVFVVQPGLTDSPLMDKADTKTHLNAAFIVMQRQRLPVHRAQLVQSAHAGTSHTGQLAVAHGRHRTALPAIRRDHLIAQGLGPSARMRGPGGCGGALKPATSCM
ncbi:hypothetical protein Vafri_1190 [Volvox africanus]|nr:hypothetical protein Vafri_1190 [Volvox africanus]